MSKKWKRKGMPAPPHDFSKGENKESCDMVRVPTDFDFFSEQARPGMFCWRTSVFNIDDNEYRIRSLWHVLPSGDAGSILIRPIPQEVEVRYNRGEYGPKTLHSWEWNGDEDRPTLSPSVWLKGRWHGYFRNGRMESCQ